jgi:hypothetical protein
MKDFEHTMEEVDSSVNPVPRNKLENIWGMFSVVDTVPTLEPTNFQNQIKIYINGATHRLYVYETSTNTWIYATLS